MTTADVVEACIDSLQGDVVNEYLQQYADILRQTTEGTDALVSDLSEEANIVYCYEEMTNLCRTYEQRLKVVEAETVERCAKVCEVMGFKHSECPEMSEYCADAIRALKVDRRKGERRICDINGPDKRSGNDRRKK